MSESRSSHNTPGLSRDLLVGPLWTFDIKSVSRNFDPSEPTCGHHLVSLFQSDPRSLGELLWVHCRQTQYTCCELPTGLMLKHARAPTSSGVLRWCARLFYLLDCRACSSKAFWFRPAPGTGWGCLGTEGFLQSNSVTTVVYKAYIVLDHSYI